MKQSRKGLVHKLDTVFSIWVRQRNTLDHGICECFTCRKSLPWKEMHAGHFASRRHMSTRWEPMNVHPQCCGCNTFRAGEQYLYGKRLDEVYGPGSAEKVMEASRTICKWTAKELQDEITRYQELTKEFN